MALELLAGLVVVGIAAVVLAVHLTGGSKADEADTGTSIVEFGGAFPGEAIRAVITTADRRTSFFRLASGKTGFLQAIGRHNVARLVEPGHVLVSSAGEGPALKINFREPGFTGGTYRFASQEEAAEVSLWLCGSFALVDGGRAEGEATKNGF